MRKNKNTSKIILGLLVFILASTISYSGFQKMKGQIDEQNRLLQSMQSTQDTSGKDGYVYAIAKTNLKSGELISEQDFDFQNFETINSDGIEDRNSLVNKVLLSDVAAGEIISKNHVAQISDDDLGLKDGFRALTLPIESFQGYSKAMKPGSFVDVYCNNPDSGWMLEKIKILDEDSLTATANTEVANAQSKTITFEVSINDISEFISNLANNKLTLVARNASDKKNARKPKKNLSSEVVASYPSLPNLPASVPISNFSGLPDPIEPVSSSSSVEIIEANTKTQVTFD